MAVVALSALPCCWPGSWKDTGNRMRAKEPGGWLHSALTPSNPSRPAAGLAGGRTRAIACEPRSVGGGGRGTGGSGRGVSGRSVSGRSVSGRSVSGRGASGRSVSGRSVSGRGVSGRGVSGWGVSGRAMSLVPIASSLLPRPLPMPSCYIGVSFENSQPQALPINHLVPVHASSLAHFTCRLLVDLGMMGVMVHQQPMMPITFHVAPPGVTRSMSEELQEEEITACKQVGL
ncbi:unnamed protein product [Closterium sp. NIES-65]|nr:unnamed protein product [Closterium sp. NIES-65]